MASTGMITREGRGCNACGVSAAKHPDCFQNKGAVSLRACSICRVALYGNADCQKSDWKDHRLLCNRVKVILALPRGSFSERLKSLVSDLAMEGQKAFAIQLASAHSAKAGCAPGVDSLRFTGVSLGREGEVLEVKNGMRPDPNCKVQQNAFLLGLKLAASFSLETGKVTVKHARKKLQIYLNEVKDLASEQMVFTAITRLLSASHNNWMIAFRGLLSGEQQRQLDVDLEKLDSFCANPIVPVSGRDS